jgi:hypothetical protein
MSLRYATTGNAFDALADEKWSPVLGYEGHYFVSDFGRIRSVWSTGRILKAYPNKHGYLVVSLSLRNVVTQHAVHRLVCKAFHGPPPSPTFHAAHLDGNKTNNCAGNLAWATPVENERHKRLHGTAIVGEAQAQAKLTEVAAREIWLSRAPSRAEAAKWGVSRQVILKIRAGRGWRHATTDLAEQPQRVRASTRIDPPDEAIRMLAEGVSRKRVALQFGVSPQTAFRWSKL